MRAAYPLRLALLELRSGLQGFRIFLACLIIGVAAIAGVGSLSDRLAEGLVREGQPLLGGDVEFSLPHRTLTQAEDEFLNGLGQTSQALTLRAMAAAQDQSALVEVKAVDGLYPLYGTLELEGGAALQPILARGQAVADPLLFTRFGLEPGARIKLGDAEIVLAAKIVREPDKISSGFALGPRLLISRETLDKAGILKPGSLASLRVRVKLADPALGAGVEARSKEAFPNEPWRVRARGQAAPQLTRGLDQLTLFLTLAGLTALITGGIGIANAVKAFLDGRRRSIAILKSLGATSGQVLTVYLAEVLIVAAVGISIGVAIGALVPWIAGSLAASVLPIPIATGIAWGALGVAALFGFTAVIAFTLWPLGRAALGEPAILLRGGVGLGLLLPSRRVMAAMAFSFLALGLLAFIRFDGWMVTVYYLGGLAAAFVLLAGLGVLVMAVARRLPRPSNATLRLAMANLHRPGAATPAMMLALGLGLTLFVALALVESGLGRELRTALPQAAPSFYFVDVDDAIEPQLSGVIAETPGVTSLIKAPMLRGRITALNGASPDSVKPTGDGVWALRGDRGVT
ncbi:MAG: FtsX-like permease family protein, partial [Aestuariivirgaceae bacterium]|nr:FtsX-like permease family protein [Aestuariivirgaceae bacterium]